MHRRAALASLLLPIAAQAQPSSSMPTNKVDSGTVLPEFDMEWIGPRPAAASKLMLIDFWATWCAPCIEHFPFLNLLAQGYGPSGLDVIALSKEPVSTIQPFLRRHPVRFLVASGGARQLQDLLKIRAVPYSILVGADRTVLWSGYLSATIPNRIEQALKST